MSRWYRAYEGTVTDAKLAEAAMVAEVSRSVSVAAWHCILESAASKNNCGSYDVTPRRIAAILCEPIAPIETLLAAFDELGLSEAGAVCAWKKRQYQSDDSKERVRHHRAKKASVTACNGDVTPPETETETDISEAKASSPRPWALPAGVSLQVWADFLGNRKRKRAGNTPSTWKRFQDDLARIATLTGIPPPKLIEHAAGAGWAGIYDPREHGNGQQRTNGMGRNQPSDGLSATTRAALSVFGAPTSHERPIPQ